MRLLTHNVLRSPMKGVVAEGYPLKIEATNVQVRVVGGTNSKQVFLPGMKSRHAAICCCRSVQLECSVIWQPVVK